MRLVGKNDPMSRLLDELLALAYQLEEQEGGVGMGRVMFPRCRECEEVVDVEGEDGTCPHCGEELHWATLNQLHKALKEVKLRGDRARDNDRLISINRLRKGKKK